MPTRSIYHDPFEDTERHLNGNAETRPAPVPSTTIRLRILKANDGQTLRLAVASSIYHDPFEDTERQPGIKGLEFQEHVPSTTIRLRILKVACLHLRQRGPN